MGGVVTDSIPCAREEIDTNMGLGMGQRSALGGGLVLGAESGSQAPVVRVSKKSLANNSPRSPPRFFVSVDSNGDQSWVEPESGGSIDFKDG